MVGLNPGKKPQRRGDSWDRFYEWLDYLELDYVSFMNLTSDPDWDGKTSGVDIAYVRDTLSMFDRVVAWGSGVSRHLDRAHIEHFVIPHPSPRNRQTNDRELVYERLSLCREYIES